MTKTDRRVVAGLRDLHRAGLSVTQRYFGVFRLAAGRSRSCAARRWTQTARLHL